MKRVFLLFSLILLTISAVGQPSEFFGLKMGEKYSRQQIIEAVGDKGVFSEYSDSVEVTEAVPMKYHAFAPAKYEGEVYSYLLIKTLENGTFTYIGFVRETDADHSPEYIDSLYQVSCKKMFELYPEIKESKFELNNVITHMHLNAYGISPKISLCKDENGSTTSYEIGFIDLISQLSSSFESPEANRPTIQDTFFGMTFKKKYSPSTIQTYVGTKGTFIEKKNEGNDNSISFKDIYFAGSKWDYGEFMTTDKNDFYFFNAYNSLNDGYSYEDERKEANRTYEYLKSKLDEKYGEGHENKDEDGNLDTYYFGNNGVIAIISNSRSKAASGQYRRFVGIKYLNKELLDNQSKTTDNEF